MGREKPIFPFQMVHVISLWRHTNITSDQPHRMKLKMFQMQPSYAFRPRKSKCRSIDQPGPLIGIIDETNTSNLADWIKMIKNTRRGCPSLICRLCASIVLFLSYINIGIHFFSFTFAVASFMMKSHTSVHIDVPKNMWDVPAFGMSAASSLLDFAMTDKLDHTLTHIQHQHVHWYHWYPNQWQEIKLVTLPFVDWTEIDSVIFFFTFFRWFGWTSDKCQCDKWKKKIK